MSRPKQPWSSRIVKLISLPVLVLAFSLAGAEVPPVALAVSSDAQPLRWTSICPYTRSAQVDPIVSPGRPSSHLHDFFGTAPDSVATQETFRVAGTSCLLDEDTAGYWAPSLYTKDSHGKYVQRIPTQAHVYYASTPTNVATVYPFPPNLKVIAGNGQAAPRSQPLNVVWFDCGPGQGPWSTPTRAPSLCPKAKHVRANIRFPACWDGTQPSVLGEDTGRMVYPGKGGCPAGWFRVPQVKLTISYPIRDGRGARLSSGGGPTNADSIYTMHADYFHAWEQNAHTALVNGCLNEGGPCGTARTAWIKAVSPASGPAGTKVTLSGKYFTGTKSVMFGGTPATFAVTSDSTLVTTVPNSAASGYIAVTTDGGTSTDLRTTGYSPSAFTVT